MAVALDNNIGFDAGASGTQSFTVGSGSDRILIVGLVYWTVFGNPTSITYNGVALTKQANIDFNGTRYNLEVWSLLNPASGSHDLVGSGGGGSGFGYTASAVITSWSGVHQTTPFGTIVNNEGSSDSPTVTVDSTGADYCVDFDGIEISVGAVTAPQTLLNAVANNYDEANMSASYRAGTGGSFAMTRNTLAASRQWGAIAVPLKAAAGGGPPANTTNFFQFF